MGQLKALQAVTDLTFFPHNFQPRVDQLFTLCVEPLGPLFCVTLTGSHVVWTEDLPKGSQAQGDHSAQLQVHKHSAGHALAAGGVLVVLVDLLQLRIALTVVNAGRVDAMLVADDLPKLARIWFLHWLAWKGKIFLGATAAVTLAEEAHKSPGAGAGSAKSDFLNFRMNFPAMTHYIF